MKNIKTLFCLCLTLSVLTSCTSKTTYGGAIPIVVDPTHPNVTYVGSSFVFTKGVFVATGAPSNSGAQISTCEASSLPPGMTIDVATCNISGTPTTLSNSLPYVITARNAQGAGTPKTIYIKIIDVIPEIVYSSPAYTFTKGASSTTGVPVNSGGAITSCTSSALPTGLTLNTLTCAISGIPSALTSAVNVFVTPTNSGGNGLTKIVAINVIDAVPNISYSGSPYSFTLGNLSTTGVPSNFGGTIENCVADFMPPGLSINSSTCEISGTPGTAAGPANITVTPSNSTGSGTSRTISVEIVINESIPVIGYSSNAFIFVRNQIGSTGAPTNTGGPATSCNINQALPQGLSINPSTCAISGTPTSTAESAYFDVTPANGAGTGAAARVGVFVHDDNSPYVNLAWDYDANEQLTLTGFKIRYGYTRGNYDGVALIAPSSLTGTVTSISPTVVYIVVTAYREQDESEYSNELSVNMSALARRRDLRIHLR